MQQKPLFFTVSTENRIFTWPIAYLLLLILVGFCSTPAFGQSTSVKTNDLVTRLIHQLSLTESLKAPQKDVKHLLKRNFLELSEQKNQKLIQAFAKSYDDKQLLDDFKDALNKKLTPRLKIKVSAWLDQSSIQTVSKAIQQYNTLQGKRKQVIAMYKIDQHPLKPQRKHILAALWDTTATLHQSVTSSLIIFRSIIKAYGKLNDKGHFNNTRINMIVQNYKTQVLLPSTRAAKKRGSHTLAIKFYNVKTKPLQKYTAFFESDAGQRLITAIDKSIQAAYQTGSRRFLNQIEKSITQ
jgi:hypothetical protein